MNNDFLKDTAYLAEIAKADFSVDYNFEGIKTIENKINENRTYYEELEEKEKRLLSFKIGSFLGVCMVKNYKGTWVEHENGYCVEIRTYAVFPFNKVLKFLSEDGLFQSISSFYEISGSLDNIINKNDSDEEPPIVSDDTKPSIKKSKRWWEFWKK